MIELNYSISLKKSPNSGIEVLKTILTFLIIVFHSYRLNSPDNKIINYLIEIAPFYFPTYFLIFFYFSYNVFSTRKIGYIKHRFVKLIVPYICWPIIFLFINIISTNKPLELENVLRDIFIQLTLGRHIYFVFWSQFNMIIISLIFGIILFSTKKYINIF